MYFHLRFAFPHRVMLSILLILLLCTPIKSSVLTFFFILRCVCVRVRNRINKSRSNISNLVRSMSSKVVYVHMFRCMVQYFLQCEDGGIPSTTNTKVNLCSVSSKDECLYLGYISNILYALSLSSTYSTVCCLHKRFRSNSQNQQLIRSVEKSLSIFPH